MTEQVARRGAKKGRKFDRSKRGHSMANYNATNRQAINKARNVAKHAASVKAAATKILRVPHGTARAKRRASGHNHKETT